MSGSKDRGVQFWDPRTGDVQLMLQGHKNSGKIPQAPDLHGARKEDELLYRHRGCTGLMLMSHSHFCRS